MGKACHRLQVSTKRKGETAFLLPPKLHRVNTRYWSAGCVFEVTFAPGDRAARIEIEDNAARADGHLGHNAFAAVDLPAGKISVAKVAVLHAENSNVGDRANSDLPQFRVADFAGRVGGGFPNNLRQRDAQREHLTHHVGQVEHDAGGGIDVEIR